MKTKAQIFFFAIVLIVLFACDNKVIFYKFTSIPETGWNKDSVLVFEFHVTDTLQNHNIFINIRNDIKYEYSNLWLFVRIEEPGGTTLTDTIEITLADPTGKWLGEGFGGIKTREAIYKSGVFFPGSGDFEIHIQQGMRNSTITGITDVGVKIEKQK